MSASQKFFNLSGHFASSFYPSSFLHLSSLILPAFIFQPCFCSYLSPSSSSFDSSSTPYGLSVLFHPAFIRSTSPFHLSPFSCVSPFSLFLSNCILFSSGPPLPAHSSVERRMFFSGAKVMERSWSAFRFWEVKAEREPHSLESEREREIVSMLEHWKRCMQGNSSTILSDSNISFPLIPFHEDLWERWIQSVSCVLKLTC